MRRAIVGVGLSLLLAGCSSSHREGGPGPVASDSETHFLTLCAITCADGLTCVCGACTLPCAGDGACGEFGASASCEAPRAVDRYSCGAIVPAAVCEAECVGDADCAAVGPDHRCEQGVCRAAPRAPATCPESPDPVCAPGEHRRAQWDGDGCASAVCEADFACSGPAADPDNCDALRLVYSFVAERARCERVTYGGCNATANNFATAEACWQSCEANNPWDCLEAFEPISRFENPVYFGIEVQPLVERIEGTHRAQLVGHFGQLQLEMTVSDVIAYYVRTADNPNPDRNSFGIPLPCRDRLQVEATVAFATPDGTFDERWPRVVFDVIPGGRARARLSLKRSDWPVNDQENITLQGSYDPGPGLNPCEMPMGLDIEIGPDSFSGAMGFPITTASCDGIVQPTPGPDSSAAARWLAIDDAGNSCQDSACCSVLAPYECDMAPQCERLFGLLYDEDRMCAEDQVAGCAAKDRGCDDGETPARDPANRCWLFRSGCLPASFTTAFLDEDRCDALLREAPTCE